MYLYVEQKNQWTGLSRQFKGTVAKCSERGFLSYLRVLSGSPANLVQIRHKLDVTVIARRDSESVRVGA